MVQHCGAEHRPGFFQGHPRKHFLLAAILGVMVAAGCVPAPETATPAAVRTALPADIDFSGRVTRVVDGDTFWISSRNVSIRVWGLDAPEVNQPGGAAATAQMTRLVAGQTLHCRQRDIDRFGRIVGQCFLPDGRDITAAMIASGTAREFCRFSWNYYGTCVTARFWPPCKIRRRRFRA